ncbi:MAG: hypothetical protein KAQ99_07775, partial [Candidatus Aureabacteria bacterium]|nr:hypothetical protein [Candidatus Auribacterota bacterium]
MRAFKANYETETAGQNETALLFQPQPLEIPAPPPAEMPAPGLHIVKEPGTTAYSTIPEKGKKNGRPVNSDLGYYFGQLKKISRDYLSTEEIKQTYEVVKKYERAILSIFYFMDSFSANLAGIGEKFKVKKEAGKKGKNGGSFTKEQLNLIAKISRKPLYKNDDKKEEILRVRAILENINKHEKRGRKKIVFQEIFEKFSGGCESYVDFITSLAEGGATPAFENYSGVEYADVRDAFNFIDE